VSWGVNLEELAAARDELAVEVGERAGSHTLERLARAHRWLGEEDAARARFLQAAAAAQAALERSGRDDAGAVSRIGSLLWRARDEAAAAPWLERAARTLTRADDAAALSYLRGDYETAVEHAERAIADERAMGEADEPRGGGGERPAAGGADDGGLVGGAPGGVADSPYPWAEAVAALAAARRDSDPARAAAAADRFAALIREERVLPDEESGSSELSLFDWLAEAARARAELEGRDGPAHASVLEQAGLLRAERGPQRPRPQPDAGPARPGSATIAYPGPDGGEVHPSVTVDDARDIHFVLDRDLRASLVQHDGMWRARLGDTDLPGTFRGPRGAKRALWDPLREQPNGQWAVALLDRLFRESFRL
jgi:tetratricopeptide (TPR) repeat protein